MSGSAWLVVHDEPHASVRRMAVPGGWLYQVERANLHSPGRVGEPSTSTYGWSSPVFVPEVRS